MINNFRPTPDNSTLNKINHLSITDDLDSDHSDKKKKKRSVESNDQKFDVLEVTYFMTNNFTSGLFNSCK